MPFSRFALRPQAPLLVSIFALLATSGCSSSDDGLFVNGVEDTDAGGGYGDDASVDGGDISNDASDGDASSGGCKTAADCNDGIACTVDVCVQGKCSYHPGPNEGATACPERQYCEAGRGCVPAAACANDAQCEAMFGRDVCKTDVRCDAKDAVCVFSVLDKDGDGHVPLVCGGDDCNDADSEIHGGAIEICDGKDNDCNGIIDDGAICPGGEVCQAGACVCPAVNLCGAECVDKSRDPLHCGVCNKACEAGQSCQDGNCICPATSLTCNGVCVDPQSDKQHCGKCNAKCGSGQACEKGECVASACETPGLHILVDRSASMSGGSWPFVTSGLSAFLKQPQSANIHAGMLLFPHASWDSADDCVYLSYLVPTVPMGLVSSDTNAVTDGLPASANGAGSILTPPLKAAASYLRSWATANPKNEPAMVVIFDGKPIVCSSDTVDTAKAEVASALSASPPIRTYVIGVGEDAKANPAIWHQVAQAGGTGAAFIVDSVAAMTTALASIRDEVAGCP